MKTLLAVILVVLIVIVLVACQPQDRHRTTATTIAWPMESSVKVHRIIDGDTLDVRDGRRLRLIGVDTPEVHGGNECYGDDASKALAKLTPPGSTVKVVYDDSTTKTLDRYHRHLVYVFTEQGQMVNAALIIEGAASAMPVYPHLTYSADFARLEDEARRAQRGMWARCYR